MIIYFIAVALLGVLLTRDGYSRFRASIINGDEKIHLPGYQQLPWTSSLPKAKALALSGMKNNREVAVVLAYSSRHHEIILNVSRYVKDNESKFTGGEVHELKSMFLVNVERPGDLRVRWTSLS